MKKNYFNAVFKIFAASVILLAIAGCASASINITMIDQDPYPVQAGEQVRFWVQIENTGGQRVENVTVQAVSKAPFSASTAESSRTYREIYPGSKQYTEFIMYVDKDAPNGPRDLTIRYNINNTSWIEKNFTVSIGGIVNTTNRGTLIIDSVTSSPEVFMPGDEGIVWVTLKNNATAPSVSIMNQSYSTNARVQSASLYSKDGIIVQSEPINDLGIIAPGDDIPIPFRVSIPEDTPDGTYLLTLNVTASSYEFNIKRNIELKVDSTGIRAIQSKQPSTSGLSRVVEIDIVNYHQGAVRGVTVIPMAEGATFYPTEYYIGDMKSGDLFTAKFTINQYGASNDTAVFTTVYYNGDNPHEDEVALKLGTASTQRSVFSLTNIILLVVLILIVAAASNYFLKKKKNMTLISYLKLQKGNLQQKWQNRKKKNM